MYFKRQNSFLKKLFFEKRF